MPFINKQKKGNHEGQVVEKRIIRAFSGDENILFHDFKGLSELLRYSYKKINYVIVYQNVMINYHQMGMEPSYFFIALLCTVVYEGFMCLYLIEIYFSIDIFIHHSKEHLIVYTDYLLLHIFSVFKFCPLIMICCCLICFMA